MATREQLMAKLREAHASGNTELAREIARRVKAMPAAAPAPADINANPPATFMDQPPTGAPPAPAPVTPSAPAAPTEPQSFMDKLNTPMTMPKGEAEIIPESPFWNKVAYSLFGPIPNVAAGAERQIAGGIRGARQVLNEFMGDTEEVERLQAEEEAARVRDVALNKTAAGRRGAAIGTGLSMVAPLGAVTKVGQAAKLPALARAGLSGLTAAGVTGATTPTVKGESRQAAMTASGIVGGLFPLMGPLAKFAGGFIPERTAKAVGSLFTSMPSDRIKREAGKQIGKITDKLQISPTTLANALRRVDPRLPQDIQDEVKKVLAVGKPRGVNITRATPIPGKTVQLQRKEAGDVSRSIQRAQARGTASVADIRTKNAYEDLIGQLDEAVANTLTSPRARKALERARTQYRTGERPFSMVEALRQGVLPASMQYMFAPAPKKPERKKEK